MGKVKQSIDNINKSHQQENGFGFFTTIDASSKSKKENVNSTANNDENSSKSESKSKKENVNSIAIIIPIKAKVSLSKSKAKSVYFEIESMLRRKNYKDDINYDMRIFDNIIDEFSLQPEEQKQLSPKVINLALRKEFDPETEIKIFNQNVLERQEKRMWPNPSQKEQSKNEQKKKKYSVFKQGDRCLVLKNTSNPIKIELSDLRFYLFTSQIGFISVFFNISVDDNLSFVEEDLHKLYRALAKNINLREEVHNLVQGEFSIKKKSNQESEKNSKRAKKQESKQEKEQKDIDLWQNFEVIEVNTGKDILNENQKNDCESKDHSASKKSSDTLDNIYNANVFCSLFIKSVEGSTADRALQWFTGESELVSAPRHDLKPLELDRTLVAASMYGAIMLTCIEKEPNGGIAKPSLDANQLVYYNRNATYMKQHAFFIYLWVLHQYYFSLIVDQRVEINSRSKLVIKKLYISEDALNDISEFNSKFNQVAISMAQNYQRIYDHFQNNLNIQDINANIKEKAKYFYSCADRTIERRKAFILAVISAITMINLIMNIISGQSMAIKWIVLIVGLVAIIIIAGVSLPNQIMKLIMAHMPKKKNKSKKKSKSKRK